MGCVIAIGGVLGVVAGAIAGVCGLRRIAAAIRILPPDDAVWLDSTIGGLAGGRVGQARPGAAGQESARPL